MNHTIMSGIILLISLLSCSVAFCGVEFIQHEYYKDGGTVCIKYRKSNVLNHVCIDSRRLRGTGQSYFGGHPDSKNSRVMTKNEIETVIKDIEMIMNSEDYRKYTAPSMSYEETKKYLKQTDSQKRREFHKARYYRSLMGFKKELSSLASKAQKTLP